jgi:hypothetical protein
MTANNRWRVRDALAASGAERLCALGAIGRFCAAPQLHRYTALQS